MTTPPDEIALADVEAAAAEDPSRGAANDAQLSLLGGKQFPVRSKNFPVLVRREFGRNPLTCRRKTEPLAAFRGWIYEISLYFPA